MWAILTNENSDKYFGVKHDVFSTLCGKDESLPFLSEDMADDFLKAFLNMQKNLAGKFLVDPKYKVVKIDN